MAIPHHCWYSSAARTPVVGAASRPPRGDGHDENPYEAGCASCRDGARQHVPGRHITRDGNGPTARQEPQTHIVHPGESIQDAVDAAHRGDTVVVTAGTYYQTVVVQKNGLTLRARGHVTLAPPLRRRMASVTPTTKLVGICVVPADLDPDEFTYTFRVRGVTIDGFKVAGFGDGVLGFGTRNLHVRGVFAVDNEGYGVASFDGIGSRIVWNSATGSDVAGIYVGDSPRADAIVKHNRTWNNQFGFFVRHTHDVTLKHNHTWKNCIGALLLDDGSPGAAATTMCSATSCSATTMPAWTTRTVRRSPVVASCCSDPATTESHTTRCSATAR